jgi:hypothetical protein
MAFVKEKLQKRSYYFVKKWFEEKKPNQIYGQSSN